MKIKDILLVGSLGLLAYYVFFKKCNCPKNNNSLPEPTPTDKPQTVVLNLTGRKKLFSDKYVKDYNASDSATVSPAKAIIQSNYDF